MNDFEIGDYVTCCKVPTFLGCIKRLHIIGPFEVARVLIIDSGGVFMGWFDEDGECVYDLLIDSLKPAYSNLGNLYH